MEWAKSSLFLFKMGGVNMVARDIEKQVSDLIAPIFENSEYELVDVEFVKEGPNFYLRIYADKDGRIAIDDCEVISRQVDVLLDEKDPISEAYILEVSSPGLDRPIKKDEDFVKFVGKMIDIKLYKAVEKQKEFQGILLGLDERDIIKIETEEKEILEFSRKDVASCRLAVIF